MKLAQRELLIPVCPEQLGGLPTPRERHEIQGGDGNDVLDNKSRVINSKGVDMTTQFVRGAGETLNIARLYGASAFIGRSGSPSCGCGKIYDGSFSGRLKSGDGIAAALLQRNGIRLISEEHFSEPRSARYPL